jgi:hypothetical protein
MAFFQVEQFRFIPDHGAPPVTNSTLKVEGNCCPATRGRPVAIDVVFITGFCLG